MLNTISYRLLLSLFIIAISSPNNLFSISKIDSLEVQLLNSTSTEKVNILNELSCSYKNISTEKVIEYATEAMGLAKEINDEKGLKNSAMILYDIYIQSGNYEYAMEKIEFLIHKSEEKEDIASLCEYLDYKAKLFIHMKVYDEALKIFSTSLDLRIKNEQTSGIGTSYLNIAHLFELLGDRSNAMEYLTKSLDQYRKAGDKQKLATTLLKTGIIADSSENPDKYFQEALELFKASGDKQNVAKTYIQYGKSMDLNSYINKALKEFEELNDTKGIADANNALGELSFSLENLNDAEAYFKNALQLYDEYSFMKGAAVVQKNMGLLLMKKGQLVNASHYLKISLETFQELNNDQLIATTSKELANIYLREGNSSKANKYNSLMLEAMNNIKLNQTANTYKLKELNSVLININNDKLIKSRNAEIDNIILKGRQQTIIFYTSVTLSIILILLTVIFYVRYKKKLISLNDSRDRTVELEQKIESSNKELHDKVNEKIITEQEKLMLLAALNQIQESVIITDPEREIIYVNNHFERTTGYTLSDIKGQTPDFLRSGELPDKIMSSISSGNIWSGTLMSRKKDGSVFHEETRVFSIKNSDNKIKHYAVIKRDLSETILNEEVIEKSEAILNSMLVNNQNSILLIDPNYTILIFNPNAKVNSSNIFGIELAENDTILKFIPQDGLKSFKQNFALALQGKSLSCDKVIKSTDNKEHLLRINFAPVETEDKKAVAVLLSVNI